MKLITFPVWVFGTICVILFSINYLVQGERIKAEQEFSSLQQPSYRLFAAVPRQSEQQVLGQSVISRDVREIKLRRFLENYNSPLAPHADTLIAAADEYDLPWTLLAAISCKESGCGRILPHGSHNAWGWAIYSGQNSGAAWPDWESAIYRVSRGIREGYFDQGLDTIAEIETRYTPQSANSHHGWRDHVTYFTELIENWEI